MTPTERRPHLTPALQPTVSARIAHVLLAVVAAQGADAAVVARAAGFDPAQAQGADARIPLEMEERLWVEAARHTGDPLFGLHAGARYQPGAMDVFDYVCRSAPDLRGAVERVVRYNRLLHDVAEYGLREEGDRAIVTHRFRAGIPGPSPLAADCTVAASLALVRHWTGVPLRARRVAIPHGPPAEATDYEAFLGTTDIIWDAPNIEIELDRAALDLPLVAADPGLCSVLERHADALLEALPQVSSFEARLREVLATELRGGTPTADVLARRLHMSTRTLHRRLAEAGTSFGQVLEGLRHGLALRYLADARVSIGEVAFLLGYSEPRAFHRAFKSWTSSTPGAWRDAHQSAS